MGLLSGHGPQSYRVTVKRATNAGILELSEGEFRGRASALAAVPPPVPSGPVRPLRHPPGAGSSLRVSFWRLPPEAPAQPGRAGPHVVGPGCASGPAWRAPSSSSTASVNPPHPRGRLLRQPPPRFRHDRQAGGPRPPGWRQGILLDPHPTTNTSTTDPSSGSGRRAWGGLGSPPLPTPRLATGGPPLLPRGWQGWTPWVYRTPTGA